MLDQADVRRSGKAYPGTMVVYTAAKLRNLIQDDADKVALFIRTATTEGQKAGPGNGELPGGFLPIEKKGSTRKLFDLAQDVADAVEAQTPLPTEEPSPTATNTARADAAAEHRRLRVSMTRPAVTCPPTRRAPRRAVRLADDRAGRRWRCRRPRRSARTWATGRCRCC